MSYSSLDTVWGEPNWNFSNLMIMFSWRSWNKKNLGIINLGWGFLQQGKLKCWGGPRLNTSNAQNPKLAWAGSSRLQSNQCLLNVHEVGLVMAGWLTGVATSSLPSWFRAWHQRTSKHPEQGLSQSTTKTPTAKKARKRGAGKTVLVCLSSGVYTVYAALLSDH